ncbi:helix-turn-helix transcriptional regulator [Pseudomonas sp. HK3]
MNKYQDTHALGGFIQRIYEAVLKPNDIHQLVNDVRSYVDAPYGAFQIENMQTHELGDSYLINYDDHAIADYAENFITKDPWTLTRLQENHLNTMFFSGHKHVKDKDYINTEFYQDWGRKNGVRHAMGCSFDIDSQYMVKVSFQRHDDQRHFDDDIEYFLNLLQPHISRFVQLSSIFQQHQQNDIAQMLTGLNRPVWVVNNKLDVLFHNEQAQTWMGAGEHLTSQNNKLLAVNSIQQSALEKQVALITQTPHNPKLWQGSHITRSYEKIILGKPGYAENFWLTPLPNCQDPNTSVALITGRKPLPKVDLICHLHGLTQRKAQLCLLLMEGCSSYEAAQHLNISINTVRNNLASCFRQLNVSNQTELMQLLFNSSCINPT